MLFPPAAAVTVAVNGVLVRSYTRAYAAGGRVYAPLRPFVTRVADRLWYDGDTLVIERDGREARVRLEPREPDALDYVYVPIGGILRELGIAVSYQAHRLDIRLAPPLLSTPSPFDATVPTVAPATVFTPEPSATPRPVWSGAPLPRRTPLPVTAATPAHTTYEGPR